MYQSPVVGLRFSGTASQAHKKWWQNYKPENLEAIVMALLCETIMMSLHMNLLMEYN